MASRYVIKTNKHLQDPKTRAAMIRRSAKSSSAVEGIVRPFEGRNPKALATASRESVSFPHR